MKKSIISGIITISAILLTNSGIHAQKVGLYECKWYSPAIFENEESLINQMQFEEKSQFLFLFSNDEDKLYIEMVLADKAAIQKVMRFGLTTWFNPDGKHKKSMGVQFPVKPDETGEPSFKREKDGDRKDMMNAMMARKNQDMVLVGFGGKGERKEIDLRVDSTFRGRIQMMEGGKLRVSIVIPLNALGRGNGTANLPFSAGFETGYLDLNREGMTAGGGQMSGGREMHGGGMPGGGMPGGGPPASGGGTGGQGANVNQQQQQPDISDLASPSKLWINQVRLAVKR